MTQSKISTYKEALKIAPFETTYYFKVTINRHCSYEYTVKINPRSRENYYTALERCEKVAICAYKKFKKIEFIKMRESQN